jgi:hypothetical protein
VAIHVIKAAAVEEEGEVAAPAAEVPATAQSGVEDESED